MTTTRFALALGFALAAPTLGPVARSQDGKPTQVAVKGTTITFDPKTCVAGRGRFPWGLGSCGVNVLGRKDGHCLFEYTQEVEMGETVYLVRVPVESGPVTVKIGRVTRGTSTYDWPVTSFPLDQAKVLRRGSRRGGWSVRVGDTDAFVTVHPAERRSEMAPRKGDTVKFWFDVYDGPQFKGRLPGAPFRPTAEFVIGSDKVWPWLAIAMEGMTVGDRVPVEVPVEVAAGAKEWLPKGSTATVLYLHVSLASTGRGK